MFNSQFAANAFSTQERAVSKWENEGGAVESSPYEMSPQRSDLTNTELVQLHIRVIALENLMIAVLAEGSGRQRQLAVEMAAQISPRPGFIQHALTVQAADHMTDLVHRAMHFQELSQSGAAPPVKFSSPKG